MKHERTLYEQTRKIDREKANVAQVVQSLPEDGIEGDLIHLGTPPMPLEYQEGYYLRLQGEWRFFGGTSTDDGDGDDDDGTTTTRPPQRTYSTRLL